MGHEDVKLGDAIANLLDECRMVLPGIQALFGFQMVAVFDSEFTKLSAMQKEAHLTAIVLVVIAIILLMAPASLHRQAEPRSASERFLNVASKLLLAAMVPLSIGICIDAYVVAHVISHDTLVSGVISGALLLLFVLFWFAYPRIYKRR